MIIVIQYVFVEMPWPLISSRLEQVQYISHLLAYIHTDAAARIRGGRVGTPNSETIYLNSACSGRNT